MSDDISARSAALLDDVEQLIDQRLDARLGKQQAGRLALPGLESVPRVPGLADELGKYSILRAAQVALSENPRSLGKEFGFEMECAKATRDSYESDSLVMKTLTAATGEAGAFLIPQEISNEIILSVIAESVLGQVGVRRVTASKGSLIFNKASTVQAFWIDSEHFEAITPSDPTFSRIELRPHALACLSGFSWEMATLSDPAIEEVARAEMSRRIAQKVDERALLGLGTQSEMRGLFNHPDVASRTVSFSGLKLGPTTPQNLLPKLRRMIAKIREDSAMVGPLGFVGEPLTAEAAEICVDADNKPLFVEVTKDQVGLLLGRPFGVTAALTNPTTTAMRFACGAWRQMILAQFGPIAFAVSNSHSTDFATGAMRLRAISMWDSAVLEPLSFVLATAYNAADVVNS